MPESPTPAPASDPAKRHSAALTDGPDRAGARAMLKAIGFTDEDLAKPLVGVGTTWIETMPCNYNQRRLAELRQGGHPGGRRDADGVQHDLGQRRRDDGHRGDEGVARSAARSSPTRSSSSSAATSSTASSASSAATRRCPARRWRSAASTSPALALYNGTIYPGMYKGQDAMRRRDASTRRSARTGRARSASTSCTRSRTSRARARAPAAASSRPTR